MSSEITSLVNLFSVGQTFTSIYFREHPRVRDAADEFVQKLNSMLRTDSNESLFLGVVHDRVVIDGKATVGPTLIARRYIENVKLCKCGGFQFRKGLKQGELIDVFVLLKDRRHPFKDRSEAQKFLESRGVKHIRLSPPYGEPGWLGDESETFSDWSESDFLNTVISNYQGLVGAVEDAHGLATEDRDVEANQARDTVATMLSTLDENADELLQLSNYPDYDSYTVGHSVRVALLALTVGHSMGLEPHVLVELGTAGLLHDVGKSRIPHEILYKPGRLTDEEFRIMQQHAWYGAEILLDTRDTGPFSVGAAFGHHIRHDRKGYPSIPDWVSMGTSTSLVQVCDVFEALTAVRPYKPGLTPLEAYRIMLKDAGSFHPTMLRQLMVSLGCYPPGSPVRISTGEQAVVTQTTSIVDRPILRVTHDAAGVAFPRKDQPTLNLSMPSLKDVSVTEMTLGDGTVVELQHGERTGTRTDPSEQPAPA